MRLRLRGAHDLELEFESAADLAAWDQLSPEQRDRFTAGMLAALNAADKARIDRKMRELRVKNGLRFVTGMALRDRQLARHRPAPVAWAAPAAIHRAAPRSRRRNVRTRASAARAPGESSEPPRPDSHLASASARMLARIRRREARASARFA